MRGCDPRSNAATFDRAGVFKLAMFNQGRGQSITQKCIGKYLIVDACITY